MPTNGTSLQTAGTPLELLGTSAGLSVVDPATILSRLWWFDGRFLRAEGFRLDQDYVRALAALSHQATGTGVVHGFDVTRPATGDSLRIAGGLALAPSGRVVYLPREVQLGIAELIARSEGTFDPGTAPEPGVADFHRCPPDLAVGPDVTVAARPLYVLTVAGIEALCGEEERFGQLCADACATETDRSTVVEGVVFRARELTLVLPTSTAVPFDARHLRSRVASAYFAAEREAVPSRISGAGLATPVWCAGAEAIGGEEVPLAVLDRSGGVTALLDGWTARRELQETSPRRYWSWRMAMRPWDVFLAQVLQFQCQLLDLGAPGGEPPDDPCADERETLTAVAEMLGGIAADLDGRLAAVRKRIAAALSGRPAGPAGPAGSGSLLLDGGIVELPPAGYLPVGLSSPVAAQVRALFGPGVDLRFCVTRPDCVPELLQQAQHLERISLTRGLDDPDDLDEVDVLVPDGVLGPPPAPAATAFAGTARIFPVVRRVAGDPESAITLSILGRDRSDDRGWSWTAVGYGEAPRQLSLRDLAQASVRIMRNAFLGEPAADGEQAEETDEAGEGPADPLRKVPLRPDAEHDRIRRSAAFTQRLVAEGSAAAARRLEVLAAGDRPPPDRPLAEGEDRPVVFWLDGTTDAAVDTLPIGASTEVRARATLYSRSRSTPVLSDIRLTGTLRVADVLTLGRRRIVRTVFDGVAEIVQTGADPRLEPVRGLPLAWAFDGAARTLAVGAGDPVVIVASAKEDGDPQHLSGELVSRRPEPEPQVETQPVPRAAGDQTLGSFEVEEQGGALAPGSSGRALAESVIAVLGAELAAPGRDPAFVQYATQRLLGDLDPAGGTTEVTATTDWVFFTRRRTVTCVGAVEPPPLKTRTYRLFHRRQDDRDLSMLDRLRRPGAAGGAGGLGFEPVTTVTFAEGQATLTSPASELRAGWLAADRGEEILLAGVGDFLADGDGEPIALSRLATVRSVLADLADSSNAQVQYLPEIPPEFHQPGLDGAMFTVGTARAQLSCVTVYGFEPQTHKRVVAALRELRDSVPIEEVIQRADATAQPYVVKLRNDAVTDPDAVRADWKDVQVVDGVLALPAGVADADATRWHARAGAVAQAIGLAAPRDEHLPAQPGSCGAALLVSALVRIG